VTEETLSVDDLTSSLTSSIDEYGYTSPTPAQGPGDDAADVFSDSFVYETSHRRERLLNEVKSRLNLKNIQLLFTVWSRFQTDRLTGNNGPPYNIVAPLYSSVTATLRSVPGLQFLLNLIPMYEEYCGCKVEGQTHLPERKDVVASCFVFDLRVAVWKELRELKFQEEISDTGLVSFSDCPDRHEVAMRYSYLKACAAVHEATGQMRELYRQSNTLSQERMVRKFRRVVEKTIQALNFWTDGFTVRVMEKREEFTYLVLDGYINTQLTIFEHLDDLTYEEILRTINEYHIEDIRVLSYLKETEELCNLAGLYHTMWSMRRKNLVKVRDILSFKRSVDPNWKKFVLNSNFKGTLVRLLPNNEEVFHRDMTLAHREFLDFREDKGILGLFLHHRLETVEWCSGIECGQFNWGFFLNKADGILELITEADDCDRAINSLAMLHIVNEFRHKFDYVSYRPSFQEAIRASFDRFCDHENKKAEHYLSDRYRTTRPPLKRVR
jgi:hypothetical protein